MKAISVCGLICSGKSTVVDRFSELYGWDVISFGAYIRHLARISGLDQTREVYQSLGERILDERDPDGFLLDVIRFNQPTSYIHLYESVRHRSIVESLRRTYESSLVIYLDVADEERYRRYLERAAQGDPPLSFGDFTELSMRPVESGIPDIRSISDICIDASVSADRAVSQIEHAIVDSHFVT